MENPRCLIDCSNSPVPFYKNLHLDLVFIWSLLNPIGVVSLVSITDEKIEKTNNPWRYIICRQDTVRANSSGEPKHGDPPIDGFCRPVSD
ncbi:hypothetical protein PGTUg99_012816 [Puccinia graminis f. sp. tritici]|uniref:Uncharacterized protein n=1 Tax=Puccinia graminis f. sp. tritici TaxID=56615 RepID=A0A5B0RYZ3_PUCGR|nr:hypothetical protein PGTUg99_012816 [Puccinia graminis f. sp. tritici]